MLSGIGTLKIDRTRITNTPPFSHDLYYCLISKSKSSFTFDIHYTKICKMFEIVTVYDNDCSILTNSAVHERGKMNPNISTIANKSLMSLVSKYSDNNWARFLYQFFSDLASGDEKKEEKTLKMTSFFFHFQR